MKSRGLRRYLLAMVEVTASEAGPLQTDPKARQVSANRRIRAWLIVVALLVFVMVLVGGITRLTHSGLSITEWQPILGVIPPLSEADWLAAFERYKQIPEYVLLNKGMSLGEFKWIYWWEWSHRLLGRLIGAVFLLPLLFFWLTGRLDRRQLHRLAAIFVLGALQGALGWYMVASGLVDRVDVSQYRLAAHLTLAAAIFAATIWVALGTGKQRRAPASFDEWTALALVGLVLLQIAAGGFVAGLDAGQGYNTWPFMEGRLVPHGLFAIEPAWRNWFENAMTVQFDHRVIAYVIVLTAAIHAWRTFSMSAMVLLYLVVLQAGIGVMTLLLHAPIGMALLHQATVLIVLAISLWHLHRKTVIRSPVRDPQ